MHMNMNESTPTSTPLWKVCRATSSVQAVRNWRRRRCIAGTLNHCARHQRVYLVRLDETWVGRDKAPIAEELRVEKWLGIVEGSRRKHLLKLIWMCMCVCACVCVCTWGCILKKLRSRWCSNSWAKIWVMALIIHYYVTCRGGAMFVCTRCLCLLNSACIYCSSQHIYLCVWEPTVYTSCVQQCKNRLIADINQAL